MAQDFRAEGPIGPCYFRDIGDFHWLPATVRKTLRGDTGSCSVNIERVGRFRVQVFVNDAFYEQLKRGKARDAANTSVLIVREATTPPDCRRGFYLCGHLARVPPRIQPSRLEIRERRRSGPINGPQDVIAGLQF